MNKRRRQRVVLGLLAVVFVIVAGRQLGSLFSADRFSGPASRSLAGRPTDPEADGWRERLPQVEELQLGALELGTEVLGDGRDPFQIRRPEPPPRRQPPPRREPIEEAAGEPETIEVETPARPAAPTPPPVDVVYLGSFGGDRVLLAVFSDGKEIFNVPEGDVLKDKFVVVRIGFESADLVFVGFPDAPAHRLEIGG